MSGTLFGKRLKSARKVADLSQKQLGIDAGIDEFSASPRVNQYEKGIHTPDFQTAKRLADCLDVPVEYFYCDSDIRAELILKVGKMTEKEQRLWLYSLTPD